MVQGGIYMPESKAALYGEALRFMREAAGRGETTMSLPEDTSLYFFAPTLCPTRVYAFVPGMVSPGKMESDVIQQMERARVRYLIWSNREFPDYGSRQFGVDFNREIHAYLSSHYKPMRPLGPPGQPGWRAVIWERIR